MSTQIRVTGLSRSFGSVRALDDVSMSVAPGEVVALLGPSGSGKSTLLRIVAGLEDATSGDVLFDGVSQLRLPPHSRDVSMVFQHFALYPHLTATDNLVLALRYGRKMDKGAALTRAKETLDLLGIADLAGRKPAQMSGGQRQRVAIGRALATRARVVLLDEPMSGLDAQLRVSLRVEILALLRRLGSTALFVTHDQSEAMVIGDRVAVLQSGRLEQLGTPDEIYDRPATRFAAGFVGSPPMNVLDGVTDQGQLRGAGFVVSAPAGAAAVGVRPEHLRPGDTIGATVAGVAVGLSVKGEVITTERLGAERVAFVSTESGVVAVRVDAAHPLAERETVALVAPADALVFFDGAGQYLAASPAPAAR